MPDNTGVVNVIGYATASSGNVAAATATATIAAVAGQTNYITGFTFTGAGATGASVVALTVVGCVGGTQTYNVSVPAGAAVGIPALAITFPTPIPASAPNTAIVVSVPTLGAGNTNSAVVAYGFRN